MGSGCALPGMRTSRNRRRMPHEQVLAAGRILTVCGLFLLLPFFGIVLYLAQSIPALSFLRGSGALAAAGIGCAILFVIAICANAAFSRGERHSEPGVRRPRAHAMAEYAIALAVLLPVLYLFFGA